MKRSLTMIKERCQAEFTGKKLYVKFAKIDQVGVLINKNRIVIIVILKISINMMGSKKMTFGITERNFT